MAKASQVVITAFISKLLEEDDVDVMREAVRAVAQALIDAEVSGQIGRRFLFLMGTYCWSFCRFGTRAPTGASLPKERRVRLVDLAEEEALVIIEDDTCRELDFFMCYIAGRQPGPRGGLRASCASAW